MNKKQILAKVKRNLDMLKIEAVQDTTSITVDGVVISCVDAEIQSPMGGVDGNVSPFLGMGVVAPGAIKVKGDTGEDTVGLILSSATRAKIFAVLCAFANDIVIEDGDSTDELARVQGHVDLHMMGS